MNKSLLLRVGAWALLLGVLWGCQKQEDETIPVLEVQKTLINADGGTQSLEVTATSSWTLSVAYAGSSQGWIHLSQTSGDAGSVFVQMTVDPNTGDEPRIATLILKGPTLQATVSITQVAAVNGTSPGWLELPALNKADCFFFTHDWDGGRYISKDKSPKRNFSFYWDPSNYVSHWVAYPLNKDLLSGNYGRYDNHTGGGFPKDPILEELGMDQPEIFDHSYGGGWTRGHQIPSADRQQEKANIATFYCTNMTPQQYDFNGGIWGKLESKVRTYANNSDTLYVCTGCYITSSSSWSGDRGGMSVRVPDAYYKALLRKKGTAYSALAFYLPHQQSIANDDFMDYKLSVSELEQKVGVDFFAALPAILGKSEAQNIEKTIANW